MYGAGLFAALIDRQDEAAVHKLLVDVDGGRGQEQHHRSLDPIFVGDEQPCGRVLAGGGDGHLAIGLKQLQGIDALAAPSSSSSSSAIARMRRLRLVSPM
jgi:hypothetical protein